VSLCNGWNPHFATPDPHFFTGVLLVDNLLREHFKKRKHVCCVIFYKNVIIRYSFSVPCTGDVSENGTRSHEKKPFKANAGLSPGLNAPFEGLNIVQTQYFFLTKEISGLNNAHCVYVNIPVRRHVFKIFLKKTYFRICRYNHDCIVNYFNYSSPICFVDKIVSVISCEIDGCLNNNYPVC
jgi:hypothetical protein